MHHEHFSWLKQALYSLREFQLSESAREDSCGVLQTVLLGDAAHTMTPALGQGLNSGLEDAAVFAQCLERHQGNVDATLPAYNKLRLPDVQAILTINEVVSTNDVGLRMLVSLTAWLTNPCILAYPSHLPLRCACPSCLSQMRQASPCESSKPFLLVSPDHIVLCACALCDAVVVYPCCVA